MPARGHEDEIGRVTLGVGAVSYAGAFSSGVTADRDAFPDLDVFVRGMDQELEALRDHRSVVAGVVA